MTRLCASRGERRGARSPADFSDRPLSADASVLIILAKAGHLGVLSEVFQEVLVESAVERECLRDLPERPDARAIEAALGSGMLKRAKAPVSGLRAIKRRHPSLGPGESGAISIARGGFVLVDDGLARRAARLEGATPVGTLGILARAHRSGAMRTRARLAATLRDVLAAGLWVDASVIETFWSRVDDK